LFDTIENRPLNTFIPPDGIEFLTVTKINLEPISLLLCQVMKHTGNYWRMLFKKPVPVHDDETGCIYFFFCYETVWGILSVTVVIFINFSVLYGSTVKGAVSRGFCSRLNPLKSQ